MEVNPRFSVSDFGLPEPQSELPDLPELHTCKENTEEDLRQLVESSVACFNDEQRSVFNTIVEEILPGVTDKDPFSPVQALNTFKGKSAKAYFLDAPGGTGKTFTIRAIQALLQLRNRTVLPVATSAVAASLLPGGRTAHSVFKIPIPCFVDSVCNISMDSTLAQEIRDASLIVWDEIVMCMRYCIEAVDRTLRAIMKNLTVPFGGKCILFSGDFRQILPVVPKGSRGMIVHLCFKSSPLYPHTRKLHLKQNMRLNALKNDPTADSSALSYPGFLLSVGEGSIPVETDDIIRLPQHVNVVKTSEELIDSVFPDICKNYTDVEWLTSRAILASTNAAATSLNEEIGNRIPGEYRLLRSADSVTADVPDQQAALELRYPQELLNSLDTGSSMPDHIIQLEERFCRDAPQKYSP